MTTPFHAKYWAHSLRLARHDGVDAISRSIGNARVDLNPHQVAMQGPVEIVGPYEDVFIKSLHDHIAHPAPGYIEPAFKHF